jgi:hypothetical protein
VTRLIIGRLNSKTDILGWEIERGGRLAIVREDGEVRSDDPSLAEYLRSRLLEPVTVPRPARDHPLTLLPGDGRYVAARVRSLRREDSELTVVGIVWNP